MSWVSLTLWGFVFSFFQMSLWGYWPKELYSSTYWVYCPEFLPPSGHRAVLLGVQAGRPKRLSLLGHLFFIFNITITSFAPKNGWGVLVYAPEYSLTSQFWSYTPPHEKLVFPRPKTKENSPLKTGCARRLLKKKLRSTFFSSSFSAVFVGNSVTPMSTLANNKRSCSKKWKTSAQNCRSLQHSHWGGQISRFWDLPLEP